MPFLELFVTADKSVKIILNRLKNVLLSLDTSFSVYYKLIYHM